MDVGDGANSDANKDVYTRFTLSGSAKLYLQHDYLVTEHTNITSGYIFKQFETKPEDYSVVQVFGAQTLSENFCIETGKTMTVMSGASLNTGSNKLYVKGTLAKEGTGSASGNIYYPLTLTNCTADSSNTSTYGDSNDLFGKAGSTITLTPTLPSGYKLVSWEVTPPQQCIRLRLQLHNAEPEDHGGGEGYASAADHPAAPKSGNYLWRRRHPQRYREE